MIKHAFYKKASPVVKEATGIYFKGLEPSSKMVIDRFEAPIQTIRRIVGDNFYDLSNSNEDLINLTITDSASFNIESIKNDVASNNFNLMNDISLFVVSIYDRFARMYGNTVIGKDFEEVKFKVAITSPTKGLIVKSYLLKISLHYLHLMILEMLQDLLEVMKLLNCNLNSMLLIRLLKNFRVLVAQLQMLQLKLLLRKFRILMKN